MKTWIAPIAAIALAVTSSAANAVNWWDLGNTKVGPKQTLQEFHEYFQQKFPKMPLEKYALGAYAFSPELYSQYQEAIQFNPGDLTLSEGKKLWETPFKNGKTYASCYPNGGKGVAAHYPMFDNKTGEVVTLGMSINACRQQNGEAPLKYGSQSLIALQTYLASLANGMPVDVKVEGPGAVKAFEEGKAYYFMKRGQLNFSCASCHVAYAGKYLRDQIISPVLGESAHFPTYRAAWSAVNTLQKRIQGCNKQVEAQPEPLESVDYRNLEYFMTYLSNGIKINVPGYRP
ncbi:MAG: sulfur oxidation c-type cytochrome SoxA [Acidithiobacillus sp.]|nr:sulfur oxidation c-type cytochrome SoxA [Acidithiobacillus sp.]